MPEDRTSSSDVGQSKSDSKSGTHVIATYDLFPAEAPTHGIHPEWTAEGTVGGCTVCPDLSDKSERLISVMIEGPLLEGASIFSIGVIAMDGRYFEPKSDGYEALITGRRVTWQLPPCTSAVGGKLLVLLSSKDNQYWLINPIVTGDAPKPAAAGGLG